MRAPHRFWYFLCCLYLKDRNLQVESVSVHPCSNLGLSPRERRHPAVAGNRDGLLTVPAHEGAGTQGAHGEEDGEREPCSDPTLSAHSPGTSAATSRTGVTAAGSQRPFLVGRVTERDC